MPRVKRKDLEQMLRVLASQLGVRVATSVHDAGALAFDYYSAGGGYKVVLLTHGAGNHNIFGERRRKPSEMADALHFAINVLSAKSDRKFLRDMQRNPGYNVTAEGGDSLKPGQTTFQSLGNGATFEFEHGEPFAGARGPWIKTGPRTYRHVEGGVEHRVGTVRAAVYGVARPRYNPPRSGRLARRR